MFDSNSPELTRPVQPLPRASAGIPGFIARHRAFLVLVCVLVAQLLLLSLQITRNHNVRLIRVWAVAAADPFERSLQGIAEFSTTAWRTYKGLWHAQQENRQLHMELTSAQAQIQQLSQQAAAVARLRSLLDFKTRLPFQTVAAEVIASSPGDSSNAIFIDKGSNDGLSVDLAVITPQGIVGKIVAIYPRTSQVLLLTDPSSGVGVTVAQIRVQGILKGNGRNLCRVQYVMNEEPIKPGDAVQTSGMDQIYPKGLPVGTVVEASKGNIYRNIAVKPVVDLNCLEEILVVLKPQTSQQQALNQPGRP
jgi:rod shape-determining protein MreC